MIKVLEVDQWTSTAENLQEMSFADFDPAKLHGGDSHAAKVLFGGHYEIKEVRETDSPSIGEVWFIEENGHFVRWKANYDSSG